METTSKNQPPNKGGKTPAQKKILIVEDHPLTRMGLVQVISREPDFLICGEAETSAEAIEALTVANPDIVLTDITLRNGSGLELIKDVMAIRPGTLVLVLSMHDESIYAERSLRAGARGYLMKHLSAGHVVEAIRKVLEGEIYVSENVTENILGFISGKNEDAGRSSIDLLTDRELEIFGLIGRGKDKNEIASQLHLSVKTVDAHRANIRIKLRLKNFADLLRHAACWVENGGGNALR